MIKLEINEPSECSLTEKEYFVELVNKGGEVEHLTVSKVERARFLAFYEKRNKNTILVGVGGIKQPSDAYRNRIFKRAKSNDKPEQYRIELGWIFVEEQFGGQHIGTTIVRELLGKVKGNKIYATTRTNNDKMKRILESFNFRESGKEFKSTRGKQSLVLFVRDC